MRITTISEELRAKVPAHTIGAIDRYVKNRIPTGGFLRAVLENDLREAMGRADSINRESLFDIVSYIYNECPAACWGSVENVEAWLNPDARTVADAASK